MGLFNSSSHMNCTCPTQSLVQSEWNKNLPFPVPLSINNDFADATEPAVGSLTFYEFNRILSGSCAALVCLIILPLMFMHATHLSKSNEQLK